MTYMNLTDDMHCVDELHALGCACRAGGDPVLATEWTCPTCGDVELANARGSHECVLPGRPTLYAQWADAGVEGAV